MSETLDHLPPHSADAERAILGALLLDTSLAGQVSELLTPADFYVRAHRSIFRAMISLSERGSEIDPLLLSEELRREGLLEQSGGMTFISELTYGLPHFANVAAYANIVKAHALSRRIVAVATKLTSDAMGSDAEPRTIIDQMREHLSELDEECARSEGGARSPLLTSFAEFMSAEFVDGDEIAFHARRGEVALVQSVTNHGKSTLIRNAALALATGGEFQPVVAGGEPRRVLLLNLEGSAGWFQNDLRVMTRDFTSREIELLRENFLPTHAPLLDGEQLSLSRHIRVLESAVRRTGGVDVLIIDTASAAFNLRNENDNAEVANSVMKPLVKLARRLNCVVVLVHHVGKAKAEEGATREQAHRGRGASAWGDFSTSIFNLDADPNDKERVTVTCGKRKNGGDYERMLRLDRERRWFRATDETPARVVTNDDLVLEAIESIGPREMQTAEILTALVGKVKRRTVMDCLNRLADAGKIENTGRGWWALTETCASCATSYRGLHNCTNGAGDEKWPSPYNLPLKAAQPNGNGFHKGVMSAER